MSGIFQEISVALRYTVSGIINTIIGYAVFWCMLRIFYVSPNISNAIGYSVALSVAFYLNRSYVFDVSDYKFSHYLKFLVSFAFAFGFNQFILWWLFYIEGVRPELAQVVSMIFYTIVFYLFNRFFVYR